MSEASRITPFQRFMSEYWTETGDLYLGSFERALDLFWSHSTESERDHFLVELEEVGQSGLIGDVDTLAGASFWDALGGRALTKREYMTALHRSARKP